MANQERTPTVSRLEEQAPNSISTLAHPEMRNKREEGKEEEEEREHLEPNTVAQTALQDGIQGSGF